MRSMRLRTLTASATLIVATMLGGCVPLPPIDIDPPLPEPAATAVTTACNELAAVVQPYGVNTLVLTTTCAAAVQGEGSTLLRTFLASPSLGCIALAGPLTALLPPVATACQDFTTAIQPYSSLLGGALDPLLG